MSLATRSGWLAYGVALAVIVLDQAAKAWILGGLHLTPGAPLDVWGPLRLNLVGNDGVSFGLLQIGAPWTRWALAAFALIVALALAVFVRKAEKPLTGLAFGLIIGGAVGNLLDRVRHGAVVDFIDVQALHFPWVFNLADSAITIGITLLLAESLIAPKKAPA